MSRIGSQSSYSTILDKHVDGVDYIELIKPVTRLGSLLNPDYVDNVKMPFGKVLSARRLMEFLNKEKYPTHFLVKMNLSNTDIAAIRKLDSKHTKGYWSVVLYYLVLKIRNSSEAYELLKNNELDFAATSGFEKDELFSRPLPTRKHIHQLKLYIGCLRIISTLIKNDKLNDDVAVGEIFERELKDETIFNILNKLS